MMTAQLSNFHPNVGNRKIDKDELVECRNCKIGLLANYRPLNPGPAAETVN